LDDVVSVVSFQAGRPDSEWLEGMVTILSDDLDGNEELGDIYGAVGLDD
jgi:hypothetical protein